MSATLGVDGVEVYKVCSSVSPHFSHARSRYSDVNPQLDRSGLGMISLTFVPVSAWRRAKAICCSVNLDFFKANSPHSELNSTKS